MKGPILICLLLTCHIGYSQITELVLSDDSYTSVIFNYHQERLQTFKVQSLSAQNGEYTWRLWTPSRLLELARSNSNASGKILTMVISEDRNTYGDIYKSEFVLSNSRALELLNYVEKTRINDVPSDIYIEDWVHGLDGVTYFIEELNGNNYSFKHYWTPSSQSGVPEAELLESMLDSLAPEINRVEVTEEIPYVAFSYFGTSYSVVKIQSKKEARKSRRRKPR